MFHIHEGKIRWEKVSHVDLGTEETEKYRLVKGDVLFNRTNSAELVGKTAVFDGLKEAVFASYLVRFKAKAGVADPGFLATYINSRRGREFIERHMARAIGQVNISASTMHRMPIPTPPLDVQRRLAAELSQKLAATETLTTRIREELAAIDALPGSLLRRAFSPGGAE